MRTNTKLRFGPEVRFDVEPVPGVFARQKVQARFDALKAQLVDQLLHQGANGMLRPQLEDVANEAAALAWTTPYPLLVLPALLEEKAQVGQVRVRRQRRIREETRALVEQALAD